jgi:hypothetical protein
MDSTSESTMENIMEIAEKHSIVPFNPDHILRIRYDLADRIIVEKIISFGDIKRVPSGYGSSRIGVIVLGANRRDYLFNISNRGLYSDFGGGVKKKKSLYEGLVKELHEEVPQWADYFLWCAEAEDVKCHVVETLFNETPEQNRIEALVFIMVDEEEMADESKMNPFEPTKEVLSVFTVNEFYIKEWLLGNDWTALNTGLQQFRKYLTIINKDFI